MFMDIPKEVTLMKEGIHPKYEQTEIRCACGMEAASACIGNMSCDFGHLKAVHKLCCGISSAFDAE